jgi:hypothetical protein
MIPAAIRVMCAGATSSACEHLQQAAHSQPVRHDCVGELRLLHLRCVVLPVHC